MLDTEGFQCRPYPLSYVTRPIQAILCRRTNHRVPTLSHRTLPRQASLADEHGCIASGDAMHSHPCIDFSERTLRFSKVNSNHFSQACVPLPHFERHVRRQPFLAITDQPHARDLRAA